MNHIAPRANVFGISHVLSHPEESVFMRELGIQAIDDRLVRATSRDIQNELLFLEICIGREQHIIDSASSQEYSQKKGKDEYFENFFYHRIMIRILVLLRTRQSGLRRIEIKRLTEGNIINP